MPNRPLSRLESIASLVTARVTTGKDPSKPYIGLEHLPSGGSSVLGAAEASESVSTNSVFRAEDVLFGKLRPRLRKSVRARFDGYCSTDMLVLRPNGGIHPPFAGFVLQSDAVFAEAIRTEEGTKMPRCSWSTLRNLLVFCPGSTQQVRIAKILSTVDEAIEQTEALIAKTQQIKAGLMHDLFTRGVTKAGRLRPPREEAPQLYKQSPLGWIPREWEVTRIGKCGSVKLGRQRSPNQHSGKWTMPYLRVANVFDGYIDYEDVLTMDFTPEERKTFLLSPGDILLNEGQSIELVGRCAIYKEEEGAYCFQNTLVRFRASVNNSPEFFRWLFKLFLDRGRFMTIAKQTTSVAHLGADRFARMTCPQVPRDEQDRIATRLQCLQSKINIDAARKRKSRELKTGLMHDLLTGRVRVKVDCDNRDMAVRNTNPKGGSDTKSSLS